MVRMHPTRRQVVHLLTATFAVAANLPALARQLRQKLTTAQIRGARATHGEQMAEEDARRINEALTRSLRDLQRLREAPIGDDVPLPVIFSAARRHGG